MAGLELVGQWELLLDVVVVALDKGHLCDHRLDGLPADHDPQLGPDFGYLQ